MAVPYYGDFAINSVVYIPINTFDSNDPSASVTVTNLLNTDVHIHKDGGTTQRNNAAGITMTIDYDSITGNHLLAIDTSDNTVADFFQAGHEYQVRVEGITVDAATINAWVGAFSLERAGGALALLKNATYGLSALESLVDDIGVAGAGLSAVPWNAAWDAEVESECTDALVAINLDHLMKTAVANNADLTAEVTDGTVLANILAKADADTSDFNPTTDSLEAIRDKLTDIETDTTEIGAAGAGLTSVAIGVGGIASTSFAANSIEAAATAADFIAEINAEVVDALNTDTYAEPSQGNPPATATFAQKIGYLYKAWRNKTLQSATEYKLYNDAGDTIDQKATVSDDATDFTRGEVGTGA